MDRRRFLKAGLGAATLLGAGSLLAEGAEGALAGGEGKKGEVEMASPWVLWYDRPASDWLHAQPIGNGRLGAMVYGGTDREILQLNEGTVWAGGPHDYANPDGLANLKEIRRLIFAGQWEDAQNLVNAHFMGRPMAQSQYQTVGSLELDFPAAKTISDYRRQLDLDEAIVTVSYTADGVKYTREAFASAPDQVIVVRIRADHPGKVAFTASLASPQHTEVHVQGADTLALMGTSGRSAGAVGAVQFQTLLRVHAERGKVQAAENKLQVSGADAVTLLISIGTGYHNYKEVGPPGAAALQHLDAASRKSYATLCEAHMADYQPRFRRFSLDLGASPASSEKPTDARIRDFSQGQDPALPALYCQFGRYLLLSCSRTGGQPATLQGLWNDSMSPPWGSKYTININTEMNYWPAGPANLLECYDPLFDMIADLTVTGAQTAKTQYGTGGWVCHHNTDAWRGTAPVDGTFWGMWPTGGAWLCKSLWDYYEYTGDKKALARHYPYLKGAAQFFLETLVEEPTHQWLVTCPSISPENAHHPNVSICAGPTMDMQILRDLFDACAQAAEILNLDADFRKQVQTARARLAPMQIGVHGQLQEWLEDWDAGAPEQQHRHVSHMYGLYPGDQITRRKTPDLFAAVRKSLETRGDESTGWAMAWRINLWARLEDGDHAYKLITGLLTPARTAPNMFDLHPPFQIDGNFGGAAGILEMLVQSHSSEIHLLPALPSAWPSGHVRGLRARGGFEIEMEWEKGQPKKVVVLSHLGGPCTVRFQERTGHFTTKAGRRYQFDGFPKSA
ncbi:MAG TPA: glycoside hydrolase N-terminal domain-containing protein [Chthonomonadaceae bacterium]|nr:glycoside hydrolase N-terminal domain-containing protein [Chthonomonadaceae bacterium]